MAQKFLLVSFPVDFGSAALARNLFSTLQTQADVRTYEFDRAANADPSAGAGAAERNLRRLRHVFKLREALMRAREEDRVVLFQQISPALFSLPFIGATRSFVILDWTRKLYESILNERLSSPLTTQLHRHVLKKAKGVLAFTEASYQSVVQDYSVAPGRVAKIPMPFDHSAFRAAPGRKDTVRILFVGGDYWRKGGDILIKWFQRTARPHVRITLVTQSNVGPFEGVEIVRNSPGEDVASIYEQNDIFVLPTRCDAYPVVLGEAACAGLALVTTNAALGAPEIVRPNWNGAVANSTEELFKILDQLVEDRAKIELFKRNSRQLILERFTFEKTFAALTQAIDSIESRGCRRGAW